jgi:hypothetical protein
MRTRSTLVATIVLLSFVGQVRSQHKDTCTVGIYVQKIYDIDYPHSSFTTDFWMWTLSTSDSLQPLKSVEISNAKSYSFSNADVERKNGMNWGSQKCQATIIKNWDVRAFPFDHQTLHIYLEEAQKDTSSLTYLADVKNSMVSDSLRMEGWRIGALHLSPVTMHYQTNYGDPSLKCGSSYAAVVATVELREFRCTCIEFECVFPIHFDSINSN